MKETSLIPMVLLLVAFSKSLFFNPLLTLFKQINKTKTKIPFPGKKIRQVEHYE